MTIVTKMPTRSNALLCLQQFNHHPIDPSSESPTQGMETKTADKATGMYMKAGHEKTTIN